MAIRLVLKGRDGELSTLLRAKTDIMAVKINKAATQASRDMARDIKKRGDADIKAGGNFGPRWTRGLHMVVTGEGLKSKIQMIMDVPYWRIFQFGGTIRGKPLLWIPIDGSDAEGLRARDYSSKFGGLFYVKRKSDGLELLGSIKTGEIKYFAKASVKQKKRFHLIEIATASLTNFGKFFLKRLEGGRRK